MRYFKTMASMFRSAVEINLAPVILLFLIFLKAEAANVKLNATASTTALTTATTESNDSSPTFSQGNISTTHITTSLGYHAPQFGGMLKRLVYVTLVLSAIIGLYFLVKFCRSAKRKPRKYGVVKTPGDMEMRPLESEDDDDEDITMFNRKD